jgi:ankyrin repeat protein
VIIYEANSQMQTNIHMNPYADANERAIVDANERAIVDGLNAARPNSILNYNERAVMNLVGDADIPGLRHRLEAGGAGHWLGVGESMGDQETPLMLCMYGMMSHKSNETVMGVIKLMMAHGADINTQLLGDSVLSNAIFYEDTEAVEGLISLGANVNSLHARSDLYASLPDRTVLFSCKRVEIAEVLLRNGADVNVRDNLGWTPLHYMIRVPDAFYNEHRIANLLIRHGANIEARTLDGETPLHFAAKYGHIAILSLLLESGACMTALDNDGRTPRQLCITSRYLSTTLFRNDIVRNLETTLILLDAEATRRARCESVAMALDQPQTTDCLLHGLPPELLRSLIQYGINYNGYGSSDSDSDSDIEGDSDIESNSRGDSGGDSGSESDSGS